MTHRPKHDRPSESGTFRISPRFLFAILLIALVAAFGLAVRYLPDLNWIVERENLLRSWIATAPVISCGFGFILYVALSLIPGTAGKSIVFGWLFGFIAALVIVEIGLTTAAIVSFLLGRFLVKHILERRWQSHLKWFRDRFEQDGAFYLLWLRMAHAPFTVVNYVAGATNIPLGTFWWTTHLGILPATLVFTFAGSRIPNIGTVAEIGVWAIVDPPLLVILTVTAFFPIVLRPWLRKSVTT